MQPLRDSKYRIARCNAMILCDLGPRPPNDCFEALKTATKRRLNRIVLLEDIVLCAGRLDERTGQLAQHEWLKCNIMEPYERPRAKGPPERRVPALRPTRRICLANIFACNQFLTSCYYICLAGERRMVCMICCWLLQAKQKKILTERVDGTNCVECFD